MWTRMHLRRLLMKSFKESVEQIDELSKKTLGRYIKKAGETWPLTRCLSI